MNRSVCILLSLSFHNKLYVPELKCLTEILSKFKSTGNSTPSILRIPTILLPKGILKFNAS